MYTYDLLHKVQHEELTLPLQKGAKKYIGSADVHMP